MQNTFLLDPNRCTACHACIVACNFENKIPNGVFLRNIYTYKKKNEGIPLFNLSLACNHCASAPCMDNCPAKAYLRDEETGALLHAPELCIGCRYCTWVCTYNAPVFNKKAGIIEKCNFCNHRLHQGEIPACANACPTGALKVIQIDDNHSNTSIPAFPENTNLPRTKILPLRKKNTGFSEVQSFPRTEKQGIQWKDEWTLFIFTILSSISVALYSTSIFTKTYPASLFLYTGLIAFSVTILHLGRKTRFLFSIINLKKSWISKEVFFFAIFLAVATIETLFLKGRLPAKIIISLCGMFALFSSDRIYSVLKPLTPSYLHSASSLYIGIFLFLLFSKIYIALLVVGSVKIALYLYRKFFTLKSQKQTIFIALRILFGLIIPLIIWILEPDFFYVFFTTSIIIGEIIDRFEFYKEFENCFQLKDISR